MEDQEAVQQLDLMICIPGKETTAMRLRPHLYEFALYCDI